MSSTNYCLICGRLSSSSSTSSSQKNNKIINQFDLHQVFKVGSFLYFTITAYQHKEQL